MKKRHSLAAVLLAAACAGLAGCGKPPAKPEDVRPVRSLVVGAGAKILGPITIGPRTRVGANSVVIQSTPPDVTVVGIPAKVVRPEFTHRRTVGRIDLDHHLMPDPVGEALSVMLDRIEFLEAQLAHIRQKVRQGPPLPAPTNACEVDPILTQGAKS